MAAARKRAGVHVALLRGINVGGRHRLPMRDLVALMEAAGCSAVRTHIQSGNAVFESREAQVRKLPTVLAAAIRDAFGFDCPVIVRSATELIRIARENPFVASGADPGTLHVGFLASRPARSRLAALDPARSPSDEFEVRGAEVYFRMPNGVAGTKLTNAYFDSTLATTITVRNWKTVGKLVDMIGG